MLLIHAATRVHICFVILSVFFAWIGLFHPLLIPGQNRTVLVVSWLFFFAFSSSVVNWVGFLVVENFA
jgi:hypothetical protein